MTKPSNGHIVTDNTERYRYLDLKPEFLEDMDKVIAAIHASGLEPYDQLTGYVRTGNERYITRRDGARDIVQQMDKKDIISFLNQR